MNDFFIAAYNGLIQTTWIEAVAVIMGIVSVWYSRKENILVFRIGGQEKKKTRSPMYYKSPKAAAHKDYNRF